MWKLYNIGCGSHKIEKAINCDINPANNPDKVFDFTKDWPIEDQSADQIIFSHTIEHVPPGHHKFILKEMWRVLKFGRTVVISYPEFKECAERYLRNEGGQKDFWEATLYGRRTSPYEFHVSLMDTSSFTKLLVEAGFRILKQSPELGEPYNTVLVAEKVTKPRSKEDVLQEVIFDKKRSKNTSSSRT